MNTSAFNKILFECENALAQLNVSKKGVLDRGCFGARQGIIFACIQGML